MAQAHPFINPFFIAQLPKNPSASQETEDPYHPYPSYFGMNMQFHPWHFFSKNWVELEQKCWQDYWEWISWQQQSFQQNVQDTLKVMAHMIQLSPQPAHLYRYYRLNWQKPYIHLSAQAITSMRLLSKLMIQNWCAWQALMIPEQKH